MAVQISGNDITVPRDGTFSRNVSIAGTLTYEDVTNVDSIGLVTARNGIEVGASPGVAASISVDGNMIVSGISTFGGDVQVPDKIIHAGDTDTAIRFSGADTITAETGGTKRLEITSDGKYYFTGTGGGSGSRGLEIDTESIGAADEGVILNARASGTTGKIKLQTNSATAVTVEGNGGNVNVASNLKVAGVCTATSFSGDGSGLTGAGKVVALAFASSTTNETNTSGADTWTLVGPQITHTAASTSNKLVFLHTHHLMIEGSMHWRMALWRDGTSGTNVYQMKTYTQLSANWSAVKGIQNVTTTAPDTSSHTYQFAIYRSTGSDSLLRYSPNSESTGSQITMLEIQP